MLTRRPQLLVAFAAATLFLALAGVALAAALDGREPAGPPPAATACTFGSSAIGPVTIDAQGHLSGNTTPETIGCIG